VNGQSEKTRELLGITQKQPHKEEADKQLHAEVQDAREDDNNCKDNKVSQRILEFLDACNCKIRMEQKVTYPPGT